MIVLRTFSVPLAMVLCALTGCSQRGHTTGLTLDSPSPVPLPTTRSVDTDRLRATCAHRVEQLETPTLRLRITGLSLDPSTSDTSVLCTVDATKWVSMLDGGVERSEARYSVHLDLVTPKTDVVEIDEEAARQVAVAALATEFLKATPTARSDSGITYSSTINGHKCIVELTMAATTTPKRWLVKKIDCK